MQTRSFYLHWVSFYIGFMFSYPTAWAHLALHSIGRGSTEVNCNFILTRQFPKWLLAATWLYNSVLQSVLASVVVYYEKTLRFSWGFLFRLLCHFRLRTAPTDVLIDFFDVMVNCDVRAAHNKSPGSILLEANIFKTYLGFQQIYSKKQ